MRCINSAFGPDTVSERSARDWFARFLTGDYRLEDLYCSGRPSEVDEDVLRRLVEADPRSTTREHGDALDVSNSTIDQHLRAMGKVSKLAQWVPHELAENHR